jgi:hypothetical protein
MSDDLIKRDDAIKAMSPMLRDMISRDKACDLIRALPTVDPAAIREAALREAAEVAEKLALEWWLTYKNIMSVHCADPHYQGKSDGADEVSDAIIALIGEPK